MIRIPKTCVYVLFALLAALYAWRVPVFEAPDEPHHLDYVSHLVERGALPDQRAPGTAVFREGHQPPLYYLTAALVSWGLHPGGPIGAEVAGNPEHFASGGRRRDVPYFLHLPPPAPFTDDASRVAFYALRALGIALGIWNLHLLLALGERFYPEAADASWSVLPAVFVATLPQFAFVSASVSNDNLANLVATATVLAAFRWWDNPASLRSALAVGVAVGLGFCTKKSLLVLLPPIGVMVLWVALRSAAPRSLLARNLGAAAGLALAMGGWVFVRNWLLYGDPLGTQMERETLSFIVADVSLFSRYFADTFWRALFLSSIGLFGWMQVKLPLLAYAWYAATLGAGALGLVLAWRTRSIDRPATILLALFALCALVGVVYYNLTFLEPQGRFLYAALAPVALLLTMGLRGVVQRLPILRDRPATVVLAWAAGALLCNLAALAAIEGFYA